ncbi:SpoIIAA family protein [Nocardiopsis salina]|uniref:STAS/SEC14 domain-containing protein n=1 Tax=Nocardiopsis salina TaxID=245836 RepID=UPI00036CD7EF|nr:STAS/SEC14 domain-containing protein [Nocardiopsis salina]
MLQELSVADGLVSIGVRGKVEKQEWEQVTGTVNEALSEYERVSLYVNLSGLEGMSVGAVLEDVRFSLKNLSNMDQLERVAVVTDSTWIEKATDASAKIFSDLEARVFSQDEEAEARQWVKP